MKKLCLLPFALSFALSATTVTYSIIGLFSNNAPVMSFGSGGNTLTLSFNPILAPATVNTPSFASFGTIQANAHGLGAQIAPGTMLAINIIQIVPGIGTGHLDGLLTGFVAGGSSSGIIQFSGGAVQIAGIEYSIANLTLAIVPPSSNYGRTTVQGFIADACDTPEGSTFAMLGLGLIGLVAWRKRYEYSKGGVV